MHCGVRVQCGENLCWAALAPEQALYIVIISVLPYGVCLKSQFEFRTALLCIVLAMCCIDQLSAYSRCLVDLYQWTEYIAENSEFRQNKVKLGRSYGQSALSMYGHGPT